LLVLKLEVADERICDYTVYFKEKDGLIIGD
jgi:hypothetical protein